jgi:hypothetical protein
VRQKQAREPDLRNAYAPLITGWKLWALCTFGVSGEGTGTTYRDPAFPACPQCGSPNVRLLRTRRNRPDQYACIEKDCKQRGICEITGSTGTERRRAQHRQLLIALVIFGAMAAIILTGHGAWLNSGS